MSNEVYANGREVSCKAAAGKAAAAFPDTCFTPPQTPATPPGVPIPYPNTGMASDTTDGSKTVQISGQEVMLKDQSCFKKSSGDEAGSAPKKGVITSKNMGKVYFSAWSMDVKFEGQNVVRHLDLTTHNHASMPGNTPTWPYVDSAASGSSSKCSTQQGEEEDKCKKIRDDIQSDPKVSKRSKNKATREAMCKDKDCRAARKCMLQPYDPKDKQAGCCKKPKPAMSPHHVVPKHCFKPPDSDMPSANYRYPGSEGYDADKAPCICVTGHDKSVGQHKKIHDRLDPAEDTWKKNGKAGSWTYSDAADAGVSAASEVTKCDADCMREQVDAYHQQKKPNISDETRIRADSTGGNTPDGFRPGRVTPSQTATGTMS